MDLRLKKKARLSLSPRPANDGYHRQLTLASSIPKKSPESNPGFFTLHCSLTTLLAGRNLRDP